MDKITLPSGAELEITLLPYEEAWGVFQRVARVLEAVNIEGIGLDIKTVLVQDAMKLKGPILQMLSNKDIVEAAKVCFKRCTYNGLKVDGKTFDERDSRQDYLPCVFHALKENIAPFFGSLISSLGMS